MRVKDFNVMFSVSLLVAFVVTLLVITIEAKPLGPNPRGPKPPGTIWSTCLHLENGAYKGDAWFGAKTGAPLKMGWMAPPAPYIADYFIDGGTNYGTIYWTEVAAPQSYSWYVCLDKGGAAPENATVSCEFENADVYFVPRDFSVVLENTDEGIHVNLRKENGYITGLPKYATLYVDNAVNVTISPSYQEGAIGENLTYMVTIKNTGRYGDNYALSASDDLGWERSLDNDLLQVPAGENRTTALHVSIDNCASNVVTVTANGAYASDSDRTTATVPPHAVELTVDPGYREGIPSNWLEYTVTVHNIGGLSDNYDLEITDDLGWGDNIYLDNMELRNIHPCENKQTTLHVHVPYCVEGGTEDNITVITTSQADNTVSDSDTCIAYVTIVRSVEVSISPEYDNGKPGTTLNYTVTVRNTGNVADNYDLTVSDNAGWGDLIEVEDNSIWVERCGENTTTLHVHMPYCVEGGTEDNITATATSQADNTVSDNASCIAHVAIARSIEILISPIYQGGLPTDTLDYTITVKNKGNVSDNYDLSVSDDAGWNLIFDNLLKDVLLCENKQVILSVVIPEDAETGTLDNLTVTATSQADPSTRAENYCTACVFKEFTLNLVAGWNLVGFVVEDTPNNLFTGLNYYENYYLYYWNPPGGPYGADLGPDSLLEDNLGYWVWIDQDYLARTIGVPPDNRTIDLLAGWNLVSFPVVNENTTIGNVFTGLTYYENYYLYYWNPPGGPYGMDLGPDSLLKDNLGYWVWIDRDWTVTVP